MGLVIKIIFAALIDDADQIIPQSLGIRKHLVDFARD